MPKSIEEVFAAHGIAVSRETLDKLNLYEQLLLRWQKVVNLIGPATIDDIPERHFADSAQLLKYIPDMNVRLVDMGSGAGFPGLVLAIMGVREVHLVESDVRKATFLREVSRETGLCEVKSIAPSVIIHDIRVEDCNIKEIDLITARALAPLTDLLNHTKKLINQSDKPYFLFLKGEKYQEEIEKAQKRFNFDIQTHQSITDNSGKVLKINNLTNK